MGAPALAGVEPGGERFGEVGVAEVEVFGLAELGGGTAEFGAGGDEFGGVEGGAAVFALVASGFGVVAVRAGAADVAVGQEALRGGVVVLLGGAFVDVAGGELTGEHVLGDRCVVGCAGGGVEVEGDGQGAPLVAELGVVAVDDCLGGGLFGVGSDGDWGAVDVGAGDH